MNVCYTWSYFLIKMANVDIDPYHDFDRKDAQLHEMGETIPLNPRGGVEGELEGGSA